jgi:hypothetical protein
MAASPSPIHAPVHSHIHSPTIASQISSDYDLAKPASIPEAREHGVILPQEASKVRNLSNISIYDTVDRCKCCLLPIVLSI